MANTVSLTAGGVPVAGLGCATLAFVAGRVAFGGVARNDVFIGPAADGCMGGSSVGATPGQILDSNIEG